uniref:Carboxy-terminal processing protease family S41 n=1 Tax=uncultured Cytophagia bacterium TaxID=768505 RepID=F4MNA0_9BACT|nr:peptidase, S41 family [uncultured bacterium]CBL88135.1 carboxy-terminal processing protease family S41 [uncultured Cytophagia bacterium]
MRKHPYLIIPITLFLFLAFKTVEQNDRYFQIVKSLDVFTTLFKEVNAYYVEEINPTELMKIGIDAMLSSLDPYTDYIPEDDIEDYRTMTTGEYGGIGAIVEKKGGVNTVVMPYENAPARRSGLLIGDQILKINNIELNGKKAYEISNLLKSQINSQITLAIKRMDRSEIFEISLVTEKIVIKNVSYAGLINRNVGYIKLSDFTTNAGKEVGEALKKLAKQGATKLILDLRGNPGGLLLEAINVANIFIPKGAEIVSTKGKLEEWTKIYSTKNQSTDAKIPLVVLTDQRSASAAEIVAGVIQDYDRGVLVGRKTYGKGLVQQTRPLAYNAQLKVTTAKYYIPSGRCIQAIDYSKESSVKIADSLKSTFRTSNGRAVLDGGGIDPDILIDPPKLSTVCYRLMQKNLIFNYATKYYFEHDTLYSARNFQLSQSEFQQFLVWLESQSFDYQTPLEIKLDQALDLAKTAVRSEQVYQRIIELNTLVQSEKKNDLVLYQDEIKRLLEQDIVSRYYLQEGIIEASFDSDPDILKATKILEDIEFYNGIIKPN